MIKVCFREADGYINLRIDGHAGYADSGEDIVCSAASILAYTVAQAIEYMSGAGKLSEPPCISLNGGSATVRCKPNADAYGEALYTYFVAQIGYDLLSRNYPDCVVLTKFGTA